MKRTKLNNVTFTKGKEGNIVGGLGRTKFSYAIKNGDSVLCLVSEDTPYAPCGGVSTLKDIIVSLEEGVNYFWKKFI